MNVLARLLAQRRMVLTLAMILSLAGVAAWMTMQRTEDPSFPNLWAQVVVPFPGADAETVERLIVRPVEDEVSDISEIKEIKSTAYGDMAVIVFILRDNITHTKEIWDRVRIALARVEARLPANVGQVQLNDDLSMQESIVLALTGSPDPVVLLAAARKLKLGLEADPLVRKVTLIADPGEQVTIEIDEAVARRLGTSSAQIALALSERNQVRPGGSLHVAGKSLRITPLGELTSVEDVRATMITLPSGSAIPLEEVAVVRRGAREPTASRMRLNGAMSVGLGVIPTDGINVVQFGENVRKRVAAIAPELAPVRVQVVVYQPERVAQRLAVLGRSLLMGILVVAGVLFVAMGFRLGLVASSVVPLVAASSIGLYAFGGGALHQVSIAALVIALGMLVDNAIVVSEDMQRRLDGGVPASEATVGTVRDLAIPLGGATATSIAAFVPLLMAEGLTASFIQAIPVVLIITLSMSYLYAVAVTPAFCALVLRPRVHAEGATVERVGRRVAKAATQHPILVLFVAAVLIASTLVGTGSIRRRFFPASDRSQFTIDLKLAEGAHLDATDEASRKLERALLEHDDVVSVASFVGRSVPHFYYNLFHIPWSPHRAQLLVETRSKECVNSMVEWSRAYGSKDLPGVAIVARKLEQGPALGAPVEIRLFSDNLDDLYESAVLVAREMREVHGAVDVRHDLSPGVPTVAFELDEAEGNRHGVAHADVARALYASTRGLPVGNLAVGSDPIPIVVLSGRGEHTMLDDLSSLEVVGRTGQSVPLSQVAEVETSWRPAVIVRRDRERVATVSAQLAPDTTSWEVLSSLQPRLERLSLPKGVKVRLGGEAQTSGEANTALMRAMPFGALILFGVLLAEFNSFRRVAIILVTIPLAAAGVVPGLLLADEPFGFMSLLGVIALVGVVVNNAIVLLEVVEARRKEGAGITEALHDAVARRIRPILLTAATTVAGLLPLALSSSTLWPPLASAMISGLIASTFLTLLVVPALYRVVFGK